MANHVLVAYDGSPQSEEALNYALEEHADAEITVLTVIDPVAAGYSPNMRLPHAAEEWYQDAKADAEELLEAAAETGDEAGVSVTTAVGVGRPANAIVEYAADNDVEQIIVGSHGRSGVSRILLGSVAEAVMRKAPVPVTIVRWGDGRKPKANGNRDVEVTADVDEDVSFDHDVGPSGGEDAASGEDAGSDEG